LSSAALAAVELALAAAGCDAVGSLCVAAAAAFATLFAAFFNHELIGDG
jgi:hypothetical protein